MAARNATNTGAAVVNALEPENDEEKKILLGGEGYSTIIIFTHHPLTLI